MIEVDSLTKVYGSLLFGKKNKVPAVDSVSLVARPGIVTGLLGPNGAGKTTILKAICGLHYPTSGSVRVMGLDVEEFPVEVRSLVGYVSEQPALIASLSVRDFLQYACRLRFAAGLPQEAACSKNIKQATCHETIGQVLDRVVAECSLEEVFFRPIGQLSKGYRQRLSFAQALLHNPPVLVLDEPVSGLDPAQIKQMRDMIKKLVRQRTILLSTHLMQEVEALCHQVYVMSGGRMVASGTVQSIAQAAGTATFEDAFLKLTAGGGAGSFAGVRPAARGGGHE